MQEADFIAHALNASTPINFNKLINSEKNAFPFPGVKP